MKFKIFICLCTLIFQTLLWAQDEVLPSTPTMQFIRWDTYHNLDVKWIRKFIQHNSWAVEHIDIPLDHPALYQVSDHHAWAAGEAGKKGPNAIIVDFAEGLPSDIRDMILLERNGKRYVRYFFSPDDTYYHLRAKDYLKKLGVPYEQGQELRGFRTASRSFIVFNPKNGRMFSLKPSTRGTSQGTSSSQDRPVPTRFSYASRRLSDFFEQRAHLLENLEIAWEPGTVGLPAIDQSYSIRTMEQVNLGQEFQLSGFVHHDEAEWARLAAQSNMSVKAFSEQAFYLKGRAMAEMTLVLGFYSHSNHAQNFRWTLSADGKLKQKIVYLDLSDGRPIRSIFESYGEHDLLTRWTQHVGDTNKVIEAREGLMFSYFFRGDWGQASDKLEKHTLRGIIDRSAELTGIAPEVLRKHFKRVRGPTEGNKYGWRLDPKHPELAPKLERYFASLPAKLGGVRPGCDVVLKQMLSDLP